MSARSRAYQTVATHFVRQDRSVWQPGIGQFFDSTTQAYQQADITSQQRGLELQNLQRSIPKCFGSREIVPVIERAQAVGRAAMPSTVSTWLPGSGDYAETNRKLIQQKIDTLEYWRQRLSTEPDTQYCPGYTGKVRSSDREQIIAAIAAPYIQASGVEGANTIRSAATADLAKDVFTARPLWDPNYDPSAPWYLKPTVMIPLAIGVVALGLFLRVKGPSAARSPAPEPAAPAPVTPVSSASAPAQQKAA